MPGKNQGDSLNRNHDKKIQDGTICIIRQDKKTKKLHIVEYILMLKPDIIYYEEMISHSNWAS